MTNLTEIVTQNKDVISGEMKEEVNNPDDSLMVGNIHKEEYVE